MINILQYLQIRRVRFIQILSGFAAICGLLVATSAPAFADTTRYICLQNTSNLCLDRPTVGATVQIDNGAQWVEHNDGHVNCSAGTPFNNGSGYNCHYNNDQIVEFENPSNTSMCLRENNSNVSLLTYGGCGAQAEFVESGGWLVSVGTTNAKGFSYPIAAEHLEVASETHGTAVGIYESGNYQNWAY